jgi:hypothetical protein
MTFISKTLDVGGMGWGASAPYPGGRACEGELAAPCPGNSGLRTTPVTAGGAPPRGVRLWGSVVSLRPGGQAMGADGSTPRGGLSGIGGGDGGPLGKYAR